MDISTAIIISLVVLLYLAIGFIVSLVHYLGTTANTPITPLKWVFIGPYAATLWLAKKF